MFGFSLTKLVFTVAVILAVWYGFKFVGRLADARKTRAKLDAASKGRGMGAPTATAELERCAACGAYVAGESAVACGRDDCPYPG
jgi:uncharacterized protein